MNTTERGEVILDGKDIFDALYKGYDIDLSALKISDSELLEQFNNSVKINADSIPQLTLYKESDQTIQEFDKLNQNQWFMPEEYRLYDIVDWLYTQCRTIEQKERVTLELKLYAQHDMIMLLKYLKYLVDTMRENKVVWGVGRGSSVASYVLYLIGIHKIDSIKYNLDINEFLK